MIYIPPQHIYLNMPIDSKFPQEDYQRLLDAYDAGDKDLIEEASKHLENGIKFEAKKIRDKYLDPPATTDFALMFLPVESLYAEVLRRTGLFEFLQREHHVIVSGPTTLAAILNSLSMGFRTLAIEKRSGDIWKILGAVKTEFERFSDILVKTQKKLDEAGRTIESAARKARTIQKKLKGVQELPQEDRDKMLAPDDEEIDEEPVESNVETA